MSNFFITTPKAGNNFSYDNIISQKTVIVPLNQQMIVYQEFSVELDGELDIMGELVIID